MVHSFLATIESKPRNMALFFRNGERVFNGIKATFLNIKNPFILNSEDATYHSVRGYFKNRDTREIDWSRGGIVKDGWEIGVQDITIAAMEEGYDGVILETLMMQVLKNSQELHIQHLRYFLLLK